MIMNLSHPVSTVEQLIAGIDNLTKNEKNKDAKDVLNNIFEELSSLPENTKKNFAQLLQPENSDQNSQDIDSSCSSKKPLEGYSSLPIPNTKAPLNVFSFKDAENNTIGWRNVYQLPVEYDLEIRTNIFDPSFNNLALKMLPHHGPKRRFLVIDENVNELYGNRIKTYFEVHGIDTYTVVIPGEEVNKRYDAVDQILEGCCEFGLHRREPIIAIGGGCILDIAGLAANLYRRGVPFIRVPTTLLALVDASVGVKNGVDYCSCSKGPQKNRVGSFYGAACVYLDKSFIATQNKRNIVNGMGEIMKLALVRSSELFELLQHHGQRLIREKFQGNDGVADQVIEKSIEIMLEELGPNLWEYKLERCVDYGHTFSKIIEMQPGADIMHGEAVNIDGFLCVVISHQRGMISSQTRDKIFTVMQEIGLPTLSEFCTVDILEQGLKDAVEHRHGAQRIPLINGIGSSICVNDITKEELARACEELQSMHAFDGKLKRSPSIKHLDGLDKLSHDGTDAPKA